MEINYIRFKKNENALHNKIFTTLIASCQEWPGTIPKIKAFIVEESLHVLKKDILKNQ